MAIQDFTAGQVLTAAQMDNLQANDYNQTVSTKTASYTLVAADKGTRVVMNSASATTITVNTSLFSAGDTLVLQNISTGVCTVTAGTATVSSAGSLAIPQNGSGVLYFTSAGVSIYYPSAVTATASGLTLITSVTASAAASITIDNCFTSTYENYRILFVGKTSFDGFNFIQLRVGGVAAATNYDSQFLQADGSSMNAGRLTAQTSGRFFAANSSDTNTASVDIFKPNIAIATSYSLLNVYAVLALNVVTGRHTTATAYDGFGIVLASGTITGTVYVYGYAK